MFIVIAFYTVRFSIHGWHARIFCQIFGVRAEEQGRGRGEEIQFYSSAGTEKYNFAVQLYNGEIQIRAQEVKKIGKSRILKLEKVSP